MSKLRVGIIGCGGIANGKHMPSITETAKAEIVAFCDLIVERAEKAKKDYGAKDAKVFTDYTELIKEDLDAVYVCTPNRSHAEITIAALKADKNVLCEKPMAINYIEAKAMVDTAKETGKILTIGYQYRYRPKNLYLKAECEENALGEIYYANAKAIRRRAVPTWGVFLNEKEQGGGPLIDIGTHALDITLWMMDNYKPVSVMGSVYHKLNGEVESANAFGPWDPKEFTVEDSAFGFIKMENGATIVLESAWALNTRDVNEARTVLCGTKAGADTLDGRLRVNGVKHNKQYVLEPDLGAGGVAFYEGIVFEDRHIEQNVFLDAVAGKGEIVIKPEQALVVTQILEAIYESNRLGKEIKL